MAGEPRIPGLISAALLAAGMSASPEDPHTIERALQVGEVRRTYLLHVPPSHDRAEPAALVVALHGGGGNARQMENFSRFSPLSDREGFIVVYPDAVGGNWNDGRGAAQVRSHRENVDDVGFVRAVLDELSKEFSIDPKRIFATGPSNGGIFSHTLGLRLSDRFAAIAPVIGGVAEPLADEWKPQRPVSVAVFQGTEDPLVPYDGGDIRAFGERARGRVIATERAVRLWVEHDRCAPEPVEEELPDDDPEDGTRVTRLTHAGGTDGTEVVLYKIAGGGHAWPGGTQYLPERAIGRVCRDIDATRLIWEFFQAHPRP